ncbi:dihydrofolate reductase family protein, partial [Candidatus Bipolaricaulota bacterium]|nr:dihydrofolate reductase family protein [Candidatus Bipolaricaulota bacterium]
KGGLGGPLRRLGAREVDSVLVEGGGEVAWAFLSQGLLNKVYLFYAPLILGGRDAVPGVGGEGFPSPQEALHLKDLTVEWVGKDLLISGYPAGREG